MRCALLMVPIAVLLAGGVGACTQSGAAAPARATPGQAPTMVFVPKFVGTDRVSKLFEQAHQGAEQAAQELQNPSPLQFAAPNYGAGGPSQIEIVANATAQGVSAIMLDNNSGDQIVPAVQAAHAKGIKLVTWDSPIASAESEDVFVAAVDRGETGQVLADLALAILGPDGGQLAILSTAPGTVGPGAWVADFQAVVKQPKYAKLEPVDLVYARDEFEPSYQQALALVDRHPDLKLIIAPTSIAIVAAAKAMQDKNLCGRVKVTGQGVPSEMRPYVLNGCVPRFDLWSFVDHGYLAYYTAYLLATGAIKAEEGQQFTAGRLGSYTITKDPTRPRGLRVLMGPFALYDKTNIDAATR